MADLSMGAAFPVCAHRRTRRSASDESQNGRVRMRGSALVSAYLAIDDLS